MKGLTWAFLEAGATRVLASRYRVKDSAAAVFMASFYSHLLQHPILEALQWLRNLGFYQGAIDSEVGAETEAAVKAFQEKHGIEASGQIDDATRGKLEEVHRT